jgi:hypothetical protein
MPTPPSAKTKSPHGSSGPDVQQVVDSPEYQGVINSPEHQEETGELVADCGKSPIPEPCQPAAVAVGDSAETAAVSQMSESDRKLATRMTKAIADQLGLSGRSRSVRV